MIDTPTPAPVYPRVCGGTTGGVSGAPSTTGLSPRVRGNRNGGDDDVAKARSIPACAGEPFHGRRMLGHRRRQVYPRVCGGTRNPAMTTMWYKPEVYPRVCGGTSNASTCTRTTIGLSPRVRGNQVPTPWHSGAERSIPACAGEPGPPREIWYTPAVYPRVCGGTSNASTCTRTTIGLSPRVRGNQVPTPWHSGAERSIPACAGEPVVRPLASVASPVYPRVCGGTGSFSTPTSPTCGLSPRVRGNQRLAAVARLVGGSIPACAGEPPAASCPSKWVRVYPRVCGGTPVKALVVAASSGLSPRVRGNPFGLSSSHRPLRSIPACAGKPAVCVAERGAIAVYPRVCGGTCLRSSSASFRSGLSPRVRGNRALPWLPCAS